jgi:nickel-dependent lactate racemase
MILFERGSVKEELSTADLKQGLTEALKKLGKRNKVLVIPPDFSRFHSRAGELTQGAFKYYGKALAAVMPATGTHQPMTPGERTAMYGDLPQELFLTHDWEVNTVTLGQVPVPFITKATSNCYLQAWPVQVNKVLVKGEYDLILSIGQVVPHEVTGMSGYNKNILIGTGGGESINSSHFIAALYGLERIMGRVETPVRLIFDYATEHFLKYLPIVYVLTVLENVEKDYFLARGLYIGDDRECFLKAAALARKVNITYMENPLKKVVVYLDPQKYKSTWLGNKAIYRTRMALADGGELIMLAPGVNCFVEAPAMDELVRKYGYVGAKNILQYLSENADLKNYLCVAAHLIHGSSEGRFTITLCPGNLTRREVESINFKYADLEQMLAKYDPRILKNGMNMLASGEEIYFISDPGLGLWMTKR